MHKGFALRFGTVLALSILMFARPTVAAKAEDVFKGKIIITKNRLPMHFSSAGGFVSALQKGKIDKIWPTEEKGDDKGTWDLEYVAFFAQPLDDSEIQVKFFDITHGDKKYVAGDESQRHLCVGLRLYHGSPILARRTGAGTPACRWD